MKQALLLIFISAFFSSAVFAADVVVGEVASLSGETVEVSSLSGEVVNVVDPIVVPEMSMVQEGGFKILSAQPYDAHTLDISFSEQVYSENNMTSAINILQSIDPVSVTQDVLDPKKIIFVSSEPLIQGATYNLVGAQTDFSFILQGAHVANPISIATGSQEIMYIEMIGDSQVEIMFSEPATLQDMELSLLREFSLQEALFLDGTTVRAILTNDLQSMQEYIIVMSSVIDAFGNERINEENSIFIFTMPTIEVPVVMPVEMQVENTGSIQVVPENQDVQIIDDILMSSAGQTPPTGTKENVIILMALLGAGIWLFSTRKNA